MSRVPIQANPVSRLNAIHLGRTELTRAALTSPITNAEMRDILRIPHDDQEAMIGLYIDAATEQAEAVTGRAFINATYTWKIDGFPAADIVLPRSPLSSVTSIAYIDSDGNSQNLASSTWVEHNGIPSRLRLAYGQEWPTARSQPQSVTITFVAGHGSDGEDVPANIRVSIAMMAAELYRTPEAAAEIEQKWSRAYASLLAAYRIPRVY